MTLVLTVGNYYLPLLICIIVASISTQVGNCSAIKCRDLSGADIDWFIVYKLPKIKESADPLIHDGVGFSSLIPGNTDWVSSSRGINDSTSFVGLTLEPLYIQNLSSDFAYITYNDQPPVGPTTDSGGHTKGVILTNSEGGFWLQHSVPHYPLLDKDNLKYSYPKTGLHNGQVLHCISLTLKQVDNLGNILKLTKPHFYNHSIPDAMRVKLPTLSKVVDNRLFEEVDDYYGIFGSNRDVVDHQMVQVQNAGRILYSFAKGPSFHEEIYSDWIAPKFQTELDVQSWLNGPNPYPSNCSSVQFKVYNIEEKEISTSKFSTHNDHAKWAIAVQQPVVCIGDLNRMEHQRMRGGTVNCFSDKTVWKAFKKTVVNTQPCPKPKRSKKKLTD